MPRDAWNPSQYERFAAERRQPFDDLRALVEPEPGMRIVDLGCGTGELTAELHEAFAARETLGIDRSAKMLERSTRFARPGLRFAPGDIAAFSADREWDLLFSNAALQWVGEHEHLVPRLAAALAPGGQLAIQVPANFDHASHRVAAEVAAEEPFAQALEGRPARVLGVLAPEAYATLLDRCGFARQHVRLQVYGHHLASRDEVVEWVRGTLLTAYEDALPPGLFPLFLERYRERLLPRLPDTRPFFFPFKRLLLWARLPEA
jgi:trans-aconitate 2-methyltransferase